MPYTEFTPEEVARRGQELYERKIRSAVEAGNLGKYLVINIETGDFEVGENYADLADRLHAVHPAAALYTLRIGYPAAGRIGGHLKASASRLPLPLRPF